MKARFEVSTEGMKELQAGREPWQLAKELVSNSWDESITKCIVELQSTDVRKSKLIVEDDGAGFSDITDAWTLMGHTPKRGNPNVRGRFNIGEKEILSIAKSAKIFTNGHVVIFPESGGRQIRKSDHRKGTRIEIVLTWGNRQVETTITKLQELLTPKGIEYTVNGIVIGYKEPTKVIETTLETTIQETIDEPMRTTRRKTNIELIPSESGMLYEMGIPIQKIQCPYLVNVMQKVPMPPNRDVVKDSYLQDIYTAILNSTVNELPKEKASETWVRQAVEDKEIIPEVVKEVMTKRYGEKVVLWSTDIRANERAIEHGYEVIHGRTLSEQERQSMANVGLVHSTDKFTLPVGQSTTIPSSEWTNDMHQVAQYAKRLAKELLDFDDLSIEMYRLPHGEAAATYSCGCISFNISRLGTSWFSDPIRPATTRLILHELGHHQGDSHNWVYDKSFQELAGKAVHLALEKPEIFRLDGK